MPGYFNAHLSVLMLLNVAELGVSALLLCWHLPRRPHYALRAAACLTAAVLYVLLAPLQFMDYAIHLPLAFLTFLFVGLCYRVNLVTTLYLGEAAYTIRCIASSVNTMVSMVNPARLDHFGTEMTGTLAGYLTIILSDAAAILVLYLVFIRRVRDVDLEHSARVPVIVLGCVVLVMNHFWVFGVQLSGDQYASSTSRMVDNAWSIVCCALVLCIQFGLFDAGRKDRELEITRTLIRQKEAQYKTSKSMIGAINKKCHQLKVQLSDLAAARGLGPDARQIDEAMALVNSFDAAVHTGSEVLDVVFTEKNFYCLQAHITFVCMIDGARLAFMGPADQYVLFGNILDGAINAVRTLPDAARRTIYVNVHAEGRLLLIQWEHPCPAAASGRPAAPDFVARSVQLIAEKYGGSVNVRRDEDAVYQNIVLPLKGGEKEA